MNWITKKVEEIGGVHKSNVAIEKLISCNDFEIHHKVSLDKDFCDFIEELGFKDFNEWIKTTTIDQIPIFTGKVCDYHKFYGFGEGEQSIDYLIELTDQLINSNDYIPFAEGASGDYICISIKPESKGKIFYMHHESDDEDDLYSVANSIRDFLNNSFKDNQDNDDLSGDLISGDFIDDYFD
ncbi:SMI1/KNR4 family protein [Fluviicola sp.]|uniref:SMI1/KNR4 family protein n=1 Tax=Fluviicola sp. TaxID=1917219 RepID=UPI003D29F6B0